MWNSSQNTLWKLNLEVFWKTSFTNYLLHNCAHWWDLSIYLTLEFILPIGIWMGIVFQEHFKQSRFLALFTQSIYDLWIFFKHIDWFNLINWFNLIKKIQILTKYFLSTITTDQKDVTNLLKYLQSEFCIFINQTYRSYNFYWFEHFRFLWRLLKIKKFNS